MLSNNIATTNSNELTQVDISQMSAYELYSIIKEMYINSIEGFNFHDLKIVKLEYHNKQMIKKNDRIDKLERQVEALKKEILELKGEIDNFKRYYGEYTSPFEILNSLFRSSDKKSYMDCLSVLNPKSKLGFNSKAIDYWLGVFEDLGIVRRIDRGRYQAMTDFKDGNNLLHNFIKKQGIKE